MKMLRQEEIFQELLDTSEFEIEKDKNYEIMMKLYEFFNRTDINVDVALNNFNQCVLIVNLEAFKDFTEILDNNLDEILLNKIGLKMYLCKSKSIRITLAAIESFIYKKIDRFDYWNEKFKGLIQE